MTLTATRPRTAMAQVATPLLRSDPQRTLRLVLATIWLLDGALQLQPVMFLRGSNGLGGMLAGAAAGEPGWLAHSITWNATLVGNHPVLTGSAFASIQLLIGLGIAWQRAVKPVLVVSIAWSLGVWWFGEGLGGVFSGVATPFSGGPGAVLMYALLAVLLWPSEDTGAAPFVAARAVGERAAKLVWALLWGLLCVLSLVGSGRQSAFLQGLVTGMGPGEPGWLAHLDRYSSALLLHDGTGLAIALAALCALLASSAFLRPWCLELAIVAAVSVFAFIWVAIQDLGGILAGGATDPNSGPLVILFALCYWPLSAGGAPRRTVIARSSDASSCS